MDEDLRQVIRLMAVVEDNAIVQAYVGMAGGGLANEKFSRFVPQWVDDERRHAQTLLLISNQSDAPLAPSKSNKYAPLLARTIHTLSDTAFLASYCIAGALAERSVIEAYRLLQDKLGPGAASDALDEVIRDEGRHLAFYEDLSKDLRRTRIGRAVSNVYAKHFWYPLGRSTLGYEGWVKIVRLLADSDDGVRRLLRVDAYARDRLGVAGFAGWSNAMRQIGLAQGRPNVSA